MLYATGGGVAWLNQNGSNASANTGDGGQGCGAPIGNTLHGGSGGSGIVIIRNHR